MYARDYFRAIILLDPISPSPSPIRNSAQKLSCLKEKFDWAAILCYLNLGQNEAILANESMIVSKQWTYNALDNRG